MEEKKKKAAAGPDDALRDMDQAFKAWMQQTPKFYAALLKYATAARDEQPPLFASLMAAWRPWMASFVHLLCVDSRHIIQPLFDDLSVRIIELTTSNTHEQLLVLEIALQEHVELQQVALQNNAVVRPFCMRLVAPPSSSSDTLKTTGAALSGPVRGVPVTEKDWDGQFEASRETIGVAFAREMTLELKAIHGRTPAPDSTTPTAAAAAALEQKEPDADLPWTPAVSHLAGMHRPHAGHLLHADAFLNRAQCVQAAVRTRVCIHMLHLLFAWPHMSWSAEAEAALLPIVCLLAQTCVPISTEQWTYTCLAQRRPLFAFLRHVFLAWETRELVPGHLAEAHLLPNVDEKVINAVEAAAVARLDTRARLDAGRTFMTKLVISKEFTWEGGFAPHLLEWAWSPKLSRVQPYTVHPRPGTATGVLYHVHQCALLAATLEAALSGTRAMPNYVEFVKVAMRIHSSEWVARALALAIAELSI